MLSSQPGVSDVTNFWSRIDTLVHEPPDKVQFLLLELKGDVVQIWDRAALDNTWVDCSAHSQSPQDCTELVLNTFLCFISLLREGGVCERSRNCKTQMNGRKSNQATHTDIIVFSLMLLIIV